MRRKDREIQNMEEMIGIIQRCDVCRVAFHDEEYPYIIPLNFGLEVCGENQLVLYFHGATEGTKYRLLAKDNRAAFEMDCSHKLVMDDEHGECTMEYESVVGCGRIEILPETEKRHGLQVLMAHYRPEPFPIHPEVMAHTAVWKLTVERCTGKRRMKR